ncbi:MAG: Asp-tRNA(Asn)/Glu-tRNA(Gln) amidotransferase subunit GatA [Fusobacteriaceae bacterium]|jgi:aspartyl-tRNA(Asn)/glutamyl-tRNA(Gln) amidotransferase subunit A|nr:Asp-tRNA(Asn)/Glu-tRNA(Gln) amidotransferase subunit GatA [Fusobacteriaceae bacterium]
MSGQWYTLTARELAAKIKNKELSALEIAEKTLARIEAVDGKVDAFVSLRREKALKEAAAVDEKIAKGEKTGVLAGVPVAVKDLLVSEGDLTTGCSRILEGYRGIYDCTAVQKLKAADAVIVGKTNADEFAMGSTTMTSCYKMTKNPWDLERVPGGSSGGSAAAVAAREVPLTLGTDTGGSIRQPASFCGVTGLKPTYGRVSRYGVMAYGSSLDQIGPFGKTVEDVALTLSVIAGPDGYDATAANRPVPDYTAMLGQSIKGLKIGVPKEYFVEGIKENVETVIRAAIETFRALGAEIVDISLPHTKYAIPAYYVIAPAEASANLARYDGIRYGHKSKNAENILDLYVNSRSEGFGDEVKRRIMIGTYVLSAGFYDAYFKKAQKVRRLIKQDYDRAFEAVDVILTPTAPSVAFKLTDEKTPIEMYLEDIFTISCNLAGIPGLVVPAGITGGLPVGVQLFARAFAEETLIRAGSAFEQARGPWSLPEL